MLVIIVGEIIEMQEAKTEIQEILAVIREEIMKISITIEDCPGTLEVKTGRSPGMRKVTRLEILILTDRMTEIGTIGISKVLHLELKIIQEGGLIQGKLLKAMIQEKRGTSLTSSTI